MLTLAKPLETLTPDEAARLLVELERLRFRILRRLEEPAEPPAAAPLTIDQAALRLGVSKSWLYRTARTHPFAMKSNGHNWRFDARGIDKYLRQRAQGAGG